MTNRLAASTSPYLLQHAGNPVDWWEWGDEAFAEAARRDVPVLLSVGYAACHWCHVMAHESFEDDATAAQMNAAFVNVKVDREERPDVDAVYMEATQALTGQGGWPMTVFLTPEGRPFYAGTYFPPQPRARHAVVPAAPDGDRGHLAAAAGRGRARPAARIAEALAGQTAFATAGGPPDAATLAAAVQALAAAEDTEHGGFGGAPKFPPSSVCEFLLRHAARGRGEGAVRRDRRGPRRPHARRDGAQRHVRPGGGRVRALRRRPRLGRAALREDALRQRPARAGLPALVAADRRSRRRPGRRGDLRLDDRRAAHRRGRPRLVARRRQHDGTASRA